MPKIPEIPKDLLSLAGEYRVCSELNKRGVFATITYGNQKSVDVYAITNRQRALKIEVKTAQTERFVTRITQKHLENDPGAPDFWVLFQIRPLEKGKCTERFFVLTHREMCKEQGVVNHRYAEKFRREHHGKSPDFSKGVDNVEVDDVEKYEDQWTRIVNDRRLRGRNS